MFKLLRSYSWFGTNLGRGAAALSGDVGSERVVKEHCILIEVIFDLLNPHAL